MAIGDGYTWCAKIGGAIVAYRPVLKDDCRQALDLYGTRTDAWHRWVVDRLHDAGNSSKGINTVLDQFERDEQGVIGVLMGNLSPNTNSPWTPEWEVDGRLNLETGLRLLRDHPGFARRACDDCKAWRYHDDGSLVRLMSGKPVPRAPEDALLCETNEGCPKGTPEKPRTLWFHNGLAFRHFRFCEATGRFPDDPIVARNAIVIRKILSEKVQPTGV